MTLLLDTPVVLWQLSGQAPVGPRTQEHLEDAQALHLSVVSHVEIAVKASNGKLRVPTDLLKHLDSFGLELLPLTPQHALAVAGMPLHHRDPFDRLLVAQAQAERPTLVSSDVRLRRYDVAFVDART